MAKPIRLADFMLGMADIVKRYPELAMSYLVIETPGGLEPVLSFDMKQLKHSPHPDHTGPDNDEASFVTLQLMPTAPDPNDPDAIRIKGIDAPKPPREIIH